MHKLYIYHYIHVHIRVYDNVQAPNIVYTGSEMHAQAWHRATYMSTTIIDCVLPVTPYSAYV